MPAELKSTTIGQTMVLTISNPEFRNALGPDIYAAGIEAITAAESNPDVRSIVITGEGQTFCAGGNLNRLLGNREQPPATQGASIEALHSWVESIYTSAKPVIAAVEGAAAGAGFSLALACDMMVAADDAVFVMAYSNVGLSPDGGGTWHLGRRLPRALASELLLLGERISATRLQQLGLINQVTQKGQALARALDVAERINSRAPNVMASIKDLLNEAGSASFTDQLASERDQFARNLFHPNGGIGIRAFLDRKKPLYDA